MRDVYINTSKEGRIVRTMKFTNGGVLVALDFNRKREVVGVEVLNSTKVSIDGKRV